VARPRCEFHSFVSAVIEVRDSHRILIDELIRRRRTAGAQNTLPLWIFGAIRLGQQLPEVNAVVVFVLLLTIIPVAISVRLTGGGGITRSSVRTTPDEARA
jgi:hypothetical protein